MKDERKLRYLGSVEAVMGQAKLSNLYVTLKLAFEYVTY